jgi:hypothetical protein
MISGEGREFVQDILSKLGTYCVQNTVHIATVSADLTSSGTLIQRNETDAKLGCG